MLRLSYFDFIKQKMKRLNSRTRQKRAIPRALDFCGHFLVIEMNDFPSKSFGSPKNRSKIIPNILHLLDHIDKLRASGNFFITPDLMRDFPEIVSLVSSRGHEIGLCCDHHHHACKTLSDLSAYKFEIESITGQNACGLLLKEGAKTGRIRLKQAAARGFAYAFTDFYPTPEEKISGKTVIKFDNETSITVFPPNYTRFLGFLIEFGRPEAVRMLPYWFLRRCLRDYAIEQEPAVLNFPLWELNPHLSRRVLSPWQSLKSYGNLSLAEFKLTRLLLEFDFCRVSSFLNTETNR